MEFRLLGPIELDAGGQLVEIGGPRQRSVLAALAVEVGRPVMVDVLVDRVWGQDPPARVRHSLQIYVVRLRGALQRANEIDGTTARLVHRSGSYALDTDPDRVDAHRFLQLIEAARDPGCADGKKAALLRQALDLWRNTPLAGMAGEWAARVGERWRQQRLEAAVRWAEAELRLDHAETVISGLGALLADFPLAESLIGAQMRALHAVGRAAEALELYAAVRQRLADELGADPDAELQELHRAILRGDLPRLTADADRKQPSSKPTVPAQLPLDVPDFTGRDAELAQLDAVVGRTTSVVISAVSGTAGVGKSALAVHWAHRRAEQFPDGQLYVDLQGYTPHAEPLPPQEVLGRFLRAFGVSDQQVPMNADERAALYRSMLDGRRVLVLLDNAATAEQVRSLLPGRGGSVAIVTSRDDLRGLVALHGARPMALDTLSPAESRMLLERILGSQRVGAEQGAVTALADLCAHLPLALRIAAANLLARPRASIADYVAGLRAGDPLAALSVDDDVGGAVRLAFDRSYESLPDPAQRLFRLLGLVPGHDITVAATAALADLSERVAADLLARLARAHLVAEPAPGRFTFHDLLRRYARDRAMAEDGEAQRTAALARLLRFYLRGADAAARQLYPQLVRLPYPEAESATPAELGDARAWLDAERPNLVAAVLAGTLVGHDYAELAWRLADALRGYFWLCRAFDDWLAVAHAADEVAAAFGNVSARAAAQLSLGVARLYMGDYEAAIAYNGTALALGEKARWPEARAAALSNLASINASRGLHAEAVGLYQQAASIHGEVGSLAGRAIQLSNLGQTEVGLGRLREAVTHLTEALSLHREVSSPSSELYTHMSLGRAYMLLGEYDRAADFLNTCLVQSRQVRHAHSEVLALWLLARLRCEQGAIDEAEELARSGASTLEQNPDRQLWSDLCNVLGMVEERRSRLDSATVHYESALRSERDSETRAESLVLLAGASLRAGRVEKASSLAVLALNLAEKHVYRVHESQALTVIAGVRLHQSDPVSATSLAARAVEIQREIGHRPGEARTELLLGCALRARDGSAKAAIPHWRRATILFEEIGVAGEIRLLRSQWVSARIRPA